MGKSTGQIIHFIQQIECVKQRWWWWDLNKDWRNLKDLFGSWFEQNQPKKTFWGTIRGEFKMNWVSDDIKELLISLGEIMV